MVGLEQVSRLLFTSLVLFLHHGEFPLSQSKWSGILTGYVTLTGRLAAEWQLLSSTVAATSTFRPFKFTGTGGTWRDRFPVPVALFSEQTWVLPVMLLPVV